MAGLAASPDHEDGLLKYFARTLDDLRRRYVQNGLHWPIELEGLRLVASQRQAAPQLATDADSRDRLCVTYKEAARQLSVSERTINRLIARGELPKVVIGDDCHRIAVADLEAYTEGLRRERAA
jgi:excisionase family DNA binding protein